MNSKSFKKMIPKNFKSIIKESNSIFESNLENMRANEIENRFKFNVNKV